MEEIKLRKTLAYIGLVIAFVGLAALIGGIMYGNYWVQFTGIVCIIVSYAFSWDVKKMREKAEKSKKDEKPKDGK
jgi:membrane protein implicated in regulation of membrane protease activity